MVGLDRFYSDQQNRKIRVKDGVFWWLNWVAGAPEEELDELLKNWRRDAANIIEVKPR